MLADALLNDASILPLSQFVLKILNKKYDGTGFCVITYLMISQFFVFLDSICRFVDQLLAFDIVVLVEEAAVLRAKL